MLKPVPNPVKDFLHFFFAGVYRRIFGIVVLKWILGYYCQSGASEFRMNHKEQISVLEKNIRELRSEADQEYEKIGKASIEDGSLRADLPMTELSKDTREEIQGLATRAADLESAQELHRTTIHEIRRSMEKLKALNSEISE